MDGGSIKGMNDKAQESRDNLHSSNKNRKKKFDTKSGAKRNGSSYFGGVFMTIAVFAVLIFFSFKILNSYDQYETQELEQMMELAPDKNLEYEQSINFGNINLENGFFEKAVSEFQNALRILPNDSTALIGLENSLDSLNK